MLIECCFVDDKDDVAIYNSKEMVETTLGEKDALYRVQVGAYRNINNARALEERLKKAGFEAIIVRA